MLFGISFEYTKKKIAIIPLLLQPHFTQSIYKSISKSLILYFTPSMISFKKFTFFFVFFLFFLLFRCDVCIIIINIIKRLVDVGIILCIGLHFRDFPFLFVIQQVFYMLTSLSLKNSIFFFKNFLKNNKNAII